MEWGHCWCTCPPLGLFLTHTHTHNNTHTLPPFSRCPYGKDFSSFSSSCSPVSQIMLRHDVHFPFYVNTFYQPSICQHKCLAPLLKSRLPHYPDLRRINLRHLKWTSPHSWYEGLNQPRTSRIHYVCCVIKRVLFGCDDGRNSSLASYMYTVWVSKLYRFICSERGSRLT